MHDIVVRVLIFEGKSIQTSFLTSLGFFRLDQTEISKTMCPKNEKVYSDIYS